MEPPVTEYVNVSGPTSSQSLIAAGHASTIALGSDGDNTRRRSVNKGCDDVDVRVDARLTCMEVMTTITVFVYAIAVMCAAGVAVYFEANPTHYVAFAFPVLIAPCVMFQRRQLQWKRYYQERNKTTRRKVIHNARQFNRMMIEKSRLERKLKRVKPVAKRFQNLVRMENKNIHHFNVLAKEDARVRRELGEFRNAMKVKTLVSAMLQATKSEHGQQQQNSSENRLRRLLRSLRDGSPIADEEHTGEFLSGVDDRNDEAEHQHATQHPQRVVAIKNREGKSSEDDILLDNLLSPGYDEVELVVVAATARTKKRNDGSRKKMDPPAEDASLLLIRSQEFV